MWITPDLADVYLLVEVSDSTLIKDRTIKLPLYAAHGIPELWIVNLVDQQIEVYTEPHGEEYLTRTQAADGALCSGALS